MTTRGDSDSACLRQWRAVEEAIDGTGARGIIWDFDGVLCDSVRVFRELIATKLDRCGLDEAAGRVRSDLKLSGRETRDVVEEILRDAPGHDVAEFARQLIDEYERVAVMALSLDADAVEIVRRGVEHGKRHCIVSNGRPDLIRTQVANAGMSDVFDAIITPTEGLSPKPSPTMFELAVNALRLRREDCVVVEDSEVGAIAARTAGLRVLRVALFGE